MTSAQTTAAKLYHEIYLERQHMREGIAYSMATSFCDDCPHRDWENYEPQSYSEMYFGITIAESCCQENPDYWAAETQRDYEMTKLMDLLKEFAGAEEIAAAQSKVAKHDS